MRVTGSGAYARPAPTPKMPPGLIELMEGLTKDVLKSNPENVYEFCAGHMQKLLEIRDGTVPKKQLSLDEKIKKAQEKIRQRIKDRQLQYDKERSGLCDEIRDEKRSVIESNNQAVIENVIRNTSSKQPVHHGDELEKISEVEIFHEPDVIITKIGNHKDDSLQKQEEVKECLVGDIEGGQDNTIIAAGDEEVNKNNVVTTKETPITSQILQCANVIAGFKKEVEQSAVATESDIPAPLEAIQRKASINDEKEELNKNMLDTEPDPSDIKNEESQREVDIKEIGKMNDENTEMGSEIEVIDKPENIGDTNPETPLHNTDAGNIDLGTQNTDVPTKSADILITSEYDLNNKTVENRDEEETKIDVQEMIKKENSEREITPTEDKETKEHLDTEIVPSGVEKNVTEIDQAVEDIVADSGLIRNASKFIENKALLVEDGNNSNDENVTNDITLVIESKIEVEKNDNEPIVETPLENFSSEENQSSDTHPALPPAETIIPARFVTQNETLPIATHVGNQEHSNDHFDENVYPNDVDDKPQIIDDSEKVTHEEHIATDVFVNENDIAHNNLSDGKTMIAKNDEGIENAEGSGMDLETAAITIQKVFRTFLFSKSRASTLDDTANDNSLDDEIEKKNEPEYIISSANLNKERRTLGISRMDTVLQTVNEEKSLSLSTDDSSTLSSAATTIQAHVRGFLVRNRLASYKTASNSSLVNSEGPSTRSLDGETNEPKKTILNIHIVPERGQFMSRDESMLTSIDLPLDNSPPSSINLHPLGYDKSEPRKQLKREDAIQSISPPSNNSGKLSEEVDSVKDSLESKLEDNPINSMTYNDKRPDVDTESCDTTLTISSTADTVVDAETYNAREVLSSPEHNSETCVKNEESAATNFSSDEMDVVTPFPNAIEKPTQEIESDEKPKLVHTGEFHDVVLQTQVKRSESSVVREFKNVLVYFLLWDKT